MRRREQRRYYPSYFIRNGSLYANARQGGRRAGAIRSLAATISIKRGALSPCNKGKRQSPNPCRRIQTAIKKNPQDKEKTEPSKARYSIIRRSSNRRFSNSPSRRYQKRQTENSDRRVPFPLMSMNVYNTFERKSLSRSLEGEPKIC